MMGDVERKGSDRGGPELAEEVSRALAESDADTRKATATPVTVLWPKGRRPSYAVKVWLQDHADDFECVSFEVSSLRPGTSVGTGIVRDLPVASLIREAVQHLLRTHLSVVERNLAYPGPATVVHTHHGADGISTEIVATDDAFREESKAYWEAKREEAATRLSRVSGKGKGRRYPPGHLEEVARIVREARRRQDPAQAAVMAVFGLKRSAAANQIARAKARGLLDTEEES